jgi:curved DNA-binding protein CbpA
MRSRNHYQVLGVAPHATHDEIRRAYRRLAQQHHPDANPEAEAGAEAMADINAAWEVLGDPEKRQTYDWVIGTTPRIREDPDAASRRDPDEDRDDLSHLFDDPDAPPVRRRPSDVLVAVPVFMFVLAVLTFAFAAMTESDGLRTASILMVPVIAGAFVAAPLFVMLRSRRK